LAEELTTLPFSVQLTNAYPVFAVALRLQEVPDAKLPPPPAAPPALGLALAVTVNPRVKLAIREMFAVSENA
jgi:hypothetical protein